MAMAVRSAGDLSSDELRLFDAILYNYEMLARRMCEDDGVRKKGESMLD